MSRAPSDMPPSREPELPESSAPSVMLEPDATWRVDFPSVGRRCLAFLFVLGIGLFVGEALARMPGFFLVLAAGFLAIVSGFAGLWSG